MLRSATSRRLSILLALTSGLGACTSPTSGSDAGPVDAGALDGGASTTDAAAADGGLPIGAPITAPAGTWTWVDFPDALCDDGSPTGIGVDLSDASSDVLVFFNGGGACWDYTTCVTLSTSAHGPFGATEFASVSSVLGGVAMLDRTDPNNPFRDYSYVFVPYCTGDLHAGTHVATYTSGASSATVHHVGRTNVEAYMRRLAASRPSPGHVVVTGSSAGGYGAVFNHPLMRAYWPAAHGYLIDDSGPLLEGDAISPTLRAAWNDAWHLGDLVGPLCGSACDADLSALYPAIAAALPSDRVALLSYTQDQTIRTYLTLTPTVFEADLDVLVTDRFASATMRSFRVAGSSHTMLGSADTIAVGGQSVLDWVRAMVTDAAWTSVGP